MHGRRVPRIPFSPAVGYPAQRILAAVRADVLVEQVQAVLAFAVWRRCMRQL